MARTRWNWLVCPQSNAFTAMLLAISIITWGQLGVDAKTIQRNKVLMISFDGFRWDYPKYFYTPNLDYVAQTGVHAPSGIRTAFVTKTLTTHFSIATGLYAENHGIVDSNMYDPYLDKTFNVGNNESIWWDVGGEPLWITAKKYNLRTGVFYWPGSDVKIRGAYPDIYQPYHIKVKYNNRVEAVAQWLAEDRVDLAMMYFNEPDHAGHQHGAASNQVGQMVQRVDGVLGYMIKLLKQRNLFEKVNILVVSDHGMANITKEDDHLIVLKDYIHWKNEVQASAGMGPVATILPRPGKEEIVYRKLRNAHPKMRVYWKEDVPERLRYSHHRRILPIVLIADVGYLISINRRDDSLIGNHGYDNMEWSMNPIFYARGPDFKQGYQTKLFDTVDIYPLVCHLLGIPPSPNNGSFEKVAHILKNVRKNGVSHEASHQPIILPTGAGDLSANDYGKAWNVSPMDQPQHRLFKDHSRPSPSYAFYNDDDTEDSLYDVDEAGEIWRQ